MHNLLHVLSIVLVHATDAILIICTFYIFWFCNAVGAIR